MEADQEDKMSFETIVVEKIENIEIITLNRPQTLNAWNLVSARMNQLVLKDWSFS